MNIPCINIEKYDNYMVNEYFKYLKDKYVKLFVNKMFLQVIHLNFFIILQITFKRILKNNEIRERETNINCKLKANHLKPFAVANFLGKLAKIDKEFVEYLWKNIKDENVTINAIVQRIDSQDYLI